MMPPVTRHALPVYEGPHEHEHEPPVWADYPPITPRDFFVCALASMFVAARLADPNAPLRATAELVGLDEHEDDELEAMLDEVAERWPGILQGSLWASAMVQEATAAYLPIELPEPPRDVNELPAHVTRCALLIAETQR